jgi:hypothetical protein
VIPLVYGELKKLAAGHPRGVAKVRSLETTALAHEAFLRLAKGQHPSCENSSTFLWHRLEADAPGPGGHGPCSRSGEAERDGRGANLLSFRT